MTGTVDVPGNRVDVFEQVRRFPEALRSAEIYCLDGLSLARQPVLSVQSLALDGQRQQVTSIASNEEKAMTLLLIDNQIQSDQRRLEGLRERLEVELEQQRDERHDELNDNQRAQENQQSVLATLEAKGRAMKRTAAAIPPTQSVNPVSPNKRLILALGFVLAGMLGVLVVSISGLLARARRKLEQEDTASAE